MYYKILNEDLRIASCKIEEIPEIMANKILESLDGDTLEALTLFYDQKDNVIVFNEGHKEYDFYLEFATKYIELPEDLRKSVKEQCMTELFTNNGIIEMFQVLDKAMELRIKIEEKKKLEEEAKKIFKILRNHDLSLYINSIPVLKEIQKIEGEDYPKCFHEGGIFLYGYMLGKRAERARRKKVLA